MKNFLTTPSALFIILIILMGTLSFIQPQQQASGLSISGKVSAIYDIPLQGVKVKCENRSTLTAADGSFTLNIPEPKKEFYTIHFSKKGYRTDYLDSIVAPKTDINIVLIQKHK